MSNDVTDYRHQGPCVGCVTALKWHQLFFQREELHERTASMSLCVCVCICMCVWHHFCLCTHTHGPQRRQLWWIIFVSSLDKLVVMWADSAYTAACRQSCSDLLTPHTLSQRLEFPCGSHFTWSVFQLAVQLMHCLWGFNYLYWALFVDIW